MTARVSPAADPTAGAESLKTPTPGTRKVLSVMLVVGIVAVAILLVVGGLGLFTAGA